MTSPVGYRKGLYYGRVFCFDLGAKIKIPEEKLFSFLSKAQALLSSLVSARQRAGVTGTIIAFEPALGPVVQLMARSMKRKVIHAES